MKRTKKVHLLAVVSDLDDITLPSLTSETVGGAISDDKDRPLKDVGSTEYFITDGIFP